MIPMLKEPYPKIACCILAFCIVAVIPVSALHSAEQSVSGSLTRGSRFTITITGMPNTAYYIWLPGTFTMTGEPYDQPPVIADGLANVAKDPSGGPYTIGSYQYNNGDGRTIRDDVAVSTAVMPSTNYYAQATTDSAGRVVVEFQTSVYTALRSYSVKVENPLAPESENFHVEQKVYSRSVSRPMVNTPVSTVVPTTPEPTVTTSFITSPAPTLLPVTLMETTPVPTTTPLPTRSSPPGAGIAAVATGIGILALRRM